MEGIDVFTKIVEQFAFPIAIAILLLFGLYKIISSYKKTMDGQIEDYKARIDKQNEDVEHLVQQYHDDFMKVTDALNNNTNAVNTMTKLIEMFIKKKDKEG